MEKIVTDKFRIICLMFCIALAFFYYQTTFINQPTWINALCSIVLFGILVAITNRFIEASNDDRVAIFYSQNGISVPINGDLCFCPWGELKVKKKFRIYKIIYIIIFSGNNFEFEYLIFFGNKISFIELTKRYTPQDHSLYLIADKW